MIQIYEKIRDCSGVGLHGWYETSVGIIRKPNSYKPINLEVKEEKAEVVEIKQKNMNKLLFFLPADSKWSRIIRRGIVIFLLAGLSGVGVDIVQNSGSYIPAVWLPLITAILAMLDKGLREFLAKE